MKKINNDSLAFEYDEDILNVWHNAFEIVEAAFGADTIKECLKEALDMIGCFTNSDDVQVYKVLKLNNRVMNILNLDNDSIDLDELYKSKKIDDNTYEINVSTENNSYKLVIVNNDIIDKELNNKYISVLERVFKIILTKMELEEKLIKTSQTDPLTNVGNRLLYSKYLEELRDKQDVNITYSLVDLFRLKYINDNYGHAYGDEYIIRTAELLKEKLSDDDMLFRIGGDEFVIISLGNKKHTMEKVIRETNGTLEDETLELDLDSVLYANYGVVEGPMDLHKQYLEADKIMSKHKAKVYKKLGINRRK